jgi:hypothetical protein
MQLTAIEKYKVLASVKEQKKKVKKVALSMKKI